MPLRFRALPVVVAVLWCGGAAQGQSKKAYPFSKTPVEAFEVLKDLSKVSGQKLGITPLEQELFTDLVSSKRWPVASMALVASGVHDRGQLQEYLNRIDALEAQASQALAPVGTDRAKGDQLLRLLHSGVLAKGYETRQTSLAGLLKENRFNCVSSAAIYNILGERLGLNVKAVEIPATALSGHVFSVLRADGAIIDVETTNKLGFNPKGKRERPDGGSFDPATGRRELDGQQLAAIIYYNRGVDLSKEKQYHPALLMYFRALCLDVANVSAIKNALADLGNWGLYLSKQGKHDEGLQVYAVALRLAPNDAGLLNNHVALWQYYALAEMRAGREDAALAVARRAAQASKQRELVDLPFGVYQLAAEELVKAGRWTDAVALAKRGVAKLEGGPAKQVEAWIANTYLRWSDAHRRTKNWQQAFAVLKKAQSEFPQDTRYAGQGLALVQELLKETAVKEPDKLAERIDELRKNQPQIKDLDKAVVNHVRQEVKQRTDKKQFEAALKVLDSRKPLIEKEAQAIGVSIYDQWARSRKGDGWKAVMETYATGLKAFPGDELLRRNAEATCDAQGVPLINAKKWTEAIEVYEAGLQLLPGNAFLEGRLGMCRKNIR